MSDEVKVGVPVSSSFDDKGTKAAAAGLHDVASAGEKAKETANDLGYSFENLKTQMLELAAFAEVVAIFKEGIEEAIKVEKSFRGIDTTAEKLGVDTKIVREEVEEFAKALGYLGGVSQGEVIEALSKQYRITQDLGQANARAALAMDIHSKTDLTFAEAMVAVEQAANGNVRSIKSLTGEIITSHDAHTRAKMAVASLEKAFKGGTKGLDDNALAVDRNAATWKNFKEGAGKIVLEMLASVIRMFQQLPELITFGMDRVEIFFHAVGDKIANVLRFVKDVTTGKGLQTSLTAFNEHVIESNRKMYAEIDASDAKYMAAVTKREKDAEATVKKNTDAHVHANKVIADDAKQKEIDLDKLDAEVAKARAARDTTLKQKYLDNAKALEAEQKSELGKITNDMKGAEEARLKIKELFALKAEALQKKWIADETKLVDEGIKQERRLDAETTRARIAAKHEQDEAEIKSAKLKKKLAKEELKQLSEIANAGLGLLSDAFGESKELSIAGAIINTAEGATKALAQGGILGAVMAAIVIATGLVEIAKIESTDATVKPVNVNTSGFDDPSNDAAARIGGHRWARDMIREFTSGASSGWAAGMGAGGNVTNNTDNRNINNITFQGSGILDASSTESLSRLQRALDLSNERTVNPSSISRSSIVRR